MCKVSSTLTGKLNCDAGLLFILFIYNHLLLGICSRFLHVSIGAPGRVHDARIFAKSGLLEDLPAGYQILADSAYPISLKVITPYTNRDALTARDVRRNEIHSSIRMMVERSFGILKKRFKILEYVESTDLDKIKNIILCCMILHNICIDMNDNTEIELDVNLLDEVVLEPDETGDKRQIRENFFRKLLGNNNY